ncbi:hypothetical protein LPJ63_000078 [Coemansia sp. RSA 2711]|nr:hypothetical protein LPJ63_000078 [Coemansia sp. RSA 2711]
MLPPGIHYVHYSALNGEKQPGMRCGFFYNFEAREVAVRRWCTESEELVAVNATDSERVRLGIRDLDKGLGAYQLDSYSRWQQLTSYITPELLQRVLPPQGCFTSATGSAYEDEEMATVRRQLRQRAERGELDANVQAIIDSEPTQSNDRFQFTHVNIRHSFPVDAAPDQIHRYSQDKTWLLRTLLDQWPNGVIDLLGEFQLSFIVILAGQNFTGIEHWKRLLHLVLGSAEALTDEQLVGQLFVPLLSVLMIQLRECPREFIASVLEQDNFVAEILQMLVLNVYECEGNAAQVLVPELDKLRRLLATFGWTLPDGRQLQEAADVEEGEYAPQIVDI